MDIREFSYILEVVKYGNYSKAAEALHVSQPSLSMYIKNLEKRLGIQFFEKQAGKNVLTEEGELYVSYAGQIVELNDTLMVKLDMLKNKKNGKVRLGMTMTRSEMFLPPVHKALKTLCPDISVDIIVDITDGLIQRVKKRDLDFILINKPSENDGLLFREILKDKMILVVNRENPICKQAVETEGELYRTLPLKLLDGQPVIVLKKGRWLRKIFDGICADAGVTPSIVQEVYTPSAAYYMVKSGFGMTFTIDSFIEQPLRSDHVEFFYTDSSCQDVSYVIASPENVQLTDGARRVMKIMQQTIQDTNAGL